MEKRRLGELILLSLLWFGIGWFSNIQFDFLQQSEPIKRVSRASEILIERQFPFNGQSDEELADRFILEMVS
ncbi:MAG: hypothetical protein AAGD96_34390, partial [Chloroflexota bacterium]